MFNHLYLDWNCSDCTRCCHRSWSDSFYQIISTQNKPFSNLGSNPSSNPFLAKKHVMLALI